ncbi:MAG: NAD(P)-dependent oxidoreductase [Chloroflexota bacterium]
MADNTETTEQVQKTLFVTGAANGVGLALTTLAVKAGYKVVGTTDLGTVGAYRIRHAGGIPAYPDLTRESAVYSAIQMAKADVVIHAAAQDLNGIPQAKVNYDDKLAWLKASTEAIFAAAGRADVDRIVHLSAANAYADSHEPVSEDASLDTRSTLGSALHSAEEVVLDGGIPGYVLRTGYIIGTHNSSAVVTEMLRAGQSMMTNDHAVAWAHEDDVARAIMAIIELEEDTSVANVTISPAKKPSPQQNLCAVLAMNTASVNLAHCLILWCNCAHMPFNVPSWKRASHSIQAKLKTNSAGRHRGQSMGQLINSCS